MHSTDIYLGSFIFNDVENRRSATPSHIILLGF